MRLRADRVNRNAPATTASEEGAEEVINRIGRFLGKSAAVNGLADQAEHDEPTQPEVENGAPGDVASSELSMPAQPKEPQAVAGAHEAATPSAVTEDVENVEDKRAALADGEQRLEKERAELNARAQALAEHARSLEIGRASCRERV